MEAPLSGVRIVDLSRAAAGPFGSMLLADLGAEVIKIEPPGGDISRISAGPKFKGESFHYLAYNRNKKSIMLDLGTVTGKEVVHDLVKISDVVWENFRPGVMDRLGVGYERLKKVNPKIIYCAISGYGSSGPYRDRPSLDPVVLALSGLMSTMGEPGRPPIRPGTSIADLIAGFYGALAVTAALRSRDLAGTGQMIEIPMLDSCFSFMTFYLTYYFLSGRVPPPLGSGHLGIAPFGLYPTKKGYVVLGSCWPRICRALGAEWLIDDPRFATQEARVEHRAELDDILAKLFLREEAEDWLEILYAEDIPSAPLNTVDKAVLDPQLIHNKAILSLQHPLGGDIKLAGNPIKMPSINPESYSPPPVLGQHTEEVLTELLGYSQGKIRRLRQEQKKHAQELDTHVHKTK